MSRPDVEGPLLAPNVLGVVARAAGSVAGLGGSVSGLGGSVAGLGELASSGRDALNERTAETLAGRALAAGAIERGDVTLAWELARLAPAARRVDAFALVLAVLEAGRRGSTQLRLRGEGDVVEVAASVARGAQLELPFAAAAREWVRPRVADHDVEAVEAGLASLAPLVGTVDDPFAPLLCAAGCVALRRWASTEWTIARDLSLRAEGPRSHEEARALVASLRAAPLEGPRGPMLLTEEQEAAVAAMLAERTVVLTGGPGTGKTSVVVSLLRALARRAHAEAGLERVAEEIRRVALAAPTGKAADRLGDAVRSALSRSADPVDATVQRCLTSPSTLHRLLGYRRGLGRTGSGGFRANRHNPLAHRLVLVDEVSMIDTGLFAHLLEAIAADATLVLLGDPDQLPSVDPGAVLRDLVRARPPGVSVQALTRSHRMDPNDPEGAHVLSVARACLGAGGADARAAPFRTLAAATAGGAPEAGEPVGGGQVVGRGGAWHLDASELPRALDAWIARHLLVEVLGALDGVDTTGIDTSGGEAPQVVRDALAQLARARILTVTRRTAEDLDAYVSGAVAAWRGELSRARRILPGEPVLAVHNDYDEDLWNGDSGVAWRDGRGEMLVSFRRGPSLRTRPLAAVAHLVERSHAVTVHKAQGSEHDEVLFVLPPADTQLASREIVYTAITRARRSALVVGRAELLAAALGRASARETGLVAAIERAQRPR
jgi:exodeoxyribonuclease V alpha subunit